LPLHGGQICGRDTAIAIKIEAEKSEAGIGCILLERHFPVTVPVERVKPLPLGKLNLLCTACLIFRLLDDAIAVPIVE
jgi:hypothetical protein